MSLNHSYSHQIRENTNTIEAACDAENERSQKFNPSPTLHDEQEVNDSYPAVGSHSWLSDNAVAHHGLPESHYDSDVSVETNPDDVEFESNVDSPDLRHSVEWEVDVDDGSERTSRPPKRQRMNASSSSSRLSKEDVEDIVRRGGPPDASWPVYRVRILKSSNDWDEIKRWEQQYKEQKQSGQRLDAEDDRPAEQATCRYPLSPRSVSGEATSAAAGSVSPSVLPPSATPSFGTIGTSGTQPSPPPHPGSSVQSNEEDVRTQLTAVHEQLEIVLANQALILTEIGLLRSRLDVSEVREPRGELPQGYRFPIHTQEELQHLNLTLADDSVCRRFERYIFSLGGDTFRSHVQNAGKALMTPFLQGQYNMLGRNNKAPFRQLTNLYTAIHTGVSERNEVDMKTFDSYLGEWLTQWRDRQKGWKRRRMEMQAQTKSGQQPATEEPEGSQ